MTRPLEGDTGIVATVTTAVTTIHIGFPETTSSGFIIQTAFEAAGGRLTLEEVRIHVERYERARGIGKGGYRLKMGGSVEGGEVEIEKKPIWEMKSMTDLTYKIEDKST